LKGKTQTGLI